MSVEALRECVRIQRAVLDNIVNEKCAVDLAIACVQKCSDMATDAELVRALTTSVECLQRLRTRIEDVLIVSAREELDDVELDLKRTIEQEAYEPRQVTHRFDRLVDSDLQWT